MKILLVEDNALTVDTLSELLRLRGHEVDWAGNGHAAFVHIGVSVPRVIVLDLFMPGCDGLEFLRQLRQQPDIGQIPVVVTTALGEEDLRVLKPRLDEYGVHVLRKPFDVEELEAALREVAPL